MTSIEIRLEDNTTPVVTAAPERAEITADLLERVRNGDAFVQHVVLVESSFGRVIVFGTAGRGEGRVAYRIVDHVADKPYDTYVLERLA